MFTSAAPCVFKGPALTERFAYHGAGNLIQEAARIAETARRTSSGVGGLRALTLNPPDDSPEGKIARIDRMLKRGDAYAAMDAVVRMLDNGAKLPPEIKSKLYDQAGQGIESLRIMGQESDAASFAARVYEHRTEKAFVPVATQGAGLAR